MVGPTIAPSSLSSSLALACRLSPDRQSVCACVWACYPQETLFFPRARVRCCKAQPTSLSRSLFWHKRNAPSFFSRYHAYAQWLFRPAIFLFFSQNLELFPPQHVHFIFCFPQLNEFVCLRTFYFAYFYDKKTCDYSMPPLPSPTSGS